jgi:hypothetical protein
MSKYFIKLILISIFALPNIEVAAETIVGEIKRIYPTRDIVYFRIKGDTCISGGQYYYFQMNDSDNTGKYAAKNWYSMLLASATSKIPVHVKVSSCPTEGHIEVDYIYQDY